MAEHVIVNSAELNWGPGPASLPAGAEMALITGHPAERGDFVIRLRFPAGFKIPPHFHSKDENLTILNGDFRLGMGSEFNIARMTVLNKDDFAKMPATMRHYAFTEKGVVLQLHGMGPFDITYVNPEDDPR